MKYTALLFIVCIALGFKTDPNALLCNSSANTTTNYTAGVSGLIIINDFSAADSEKENEFGDAEDWLQLHNTTGNTLQLEEGKWFLTDDVSGEPKKFELPEFTIEPYGSLIIWCDNLNTEGDEIHANFKISSSGEKLGLFYDNSETVVMIDLCEVEASEQSMN